MAVSRRVPHNNDLRFARSQTIVCSVAGIEAKCTIARIIQRETGSASCERERDIVTSIRITRAQIASNQSCCALGRVGIRCTGNRRIVGTIDGDRQRACRRVGAISHRVVEFNCTGRTSGEAVVIGVSSIERVAAIGVERQSCRRAASSCECERIAIGITVVAAHTAIDHRCFCNGCCICSRNRRVVGSSHRHRERGCNRRTLAVSHHVTDSDVLALTNTQALVGRVGRVEAERASVGVGQSQAGSGTAQSEGERITICISSRQRAGQRCSVLGDGADKRFGGWRVIGANHRNCQRAAGRCSRTVSHGVANIEHLLIASTQAVVGRVVGVENERAVRVEREAVRRINVQRVCCRIVCIDITVVAGNRTEDDGAALRSTNIISNGNWRVIGAGYGNCQSRLAGRTFRVSRDETNLH